MKVVLDTNIIVSGLLFGGKPLQILEGVVDGKIEVYTSEVLMDECLRILEMKFGLSRDRLTETEESLRENFKIVRPQTTVKIARDTDDDAVLAVALEVGADFLVSGDNDLLVLKHIANIPIVDPGQFLSQLTQR
ncbi:MAG: putative toxin-antitoxin system toxin component, PIN family [Candidatus Berkelbacteria bacterium]|nr:putative toxin-antitoxin system toxin component, PIN family [Candidatus Berkelbacteria bacterium]